MKKRTIIFPPQGVGRMRPLAQKLSEGLSPLSISIEIKARCPNPAYVRSILRSRRAIFKGLDHQVDMYFRVPSGRLKLREGHIENALIYYKRADQKGSKRCDSLL